MKITQIFSLLITGFFVAVLCGCGKSDKDACLLLGDAVVSSLQTHKVATGTYPVAVDAVHPGGIPKLNAATKADWAYSAHGVYFDLRFRLKGAEYKYTSETLRWVDGANF